MNDHDRIGVLEDALAQFLKPIKNVPFPSVVLALSDHTVERVNMDDEKDFELVEALKKLAPMVADALRKRPIKRPRPNEVGNDIEPFVMAAAEQVGFAVARPTTKSGVAKTVGYPDILLTDNYGRKTYLECKIYSATTEKSTMRSFYLSPSEDFKVCHSARHILIAFQMESSEIQGENLRSYTANGYKLVDLYDLLCDVKHEFNSDNSRLYKPSMLLGFGDL